MTLSTLADIYEALPHAEFIGTAPAMRRVISSIETDTRTLKKGSLFVALRGENFDGHDYLKEAAKRGAKGAIVSRNPFGRRTPPLPLFIVRDTLEAYGRLAMLHRRAFSIPVVAIAGSVGKTATKEMLAAILATKFRVLKTEKNLNNRIGTPRTLLQLEKKHDVAVVEIGTNRPGEIAILSRIVEPTHGVITNIGEEHLELLKSIEGVAREEGALFVELERLGGRPFLNLDDPMIRRMKKELSGGVTFGRTKRADYQVKIGSLDEQGCPEIEIIEHRGSKKRSFAVRLCTPGKHTAINALAASAIAFDLGVPPTKIAAALRDFAPEVDAEHGYARLALVDLPDGGRILNDTYNANPDSLRAAIETLEGMKIPRSGRRIAVLGDMAELGAQSKEAHREVGRLVAQSRVDIAFFTGRGMRRAYDEIAGADRPAGVTSFYFGNREKLARILRELRGPNDVILVKGSRSAGMEQVVSFLVDVVEEAAERGELKKRGRKVAGSSSSKRRKKKSSAKKSTKQKSKAKKAAKKASKKVSKKAEKKAAKKVAKKAKGKSTDTSTRKKTTKKRR